MVYMTVHYDGSGRLNSIDLDQSQQEGASCAVQARTALPWCIGAGSFRRLRAPQFVGAEVGGSTP